METIDVIRASAVSTNWRVYEKFKDLINWVLMAHDKSVSIQSFRLFCLNNDDDHSLYRWVNILAQKHVRELYLIITSDSEKPFALPRCLLASDSLEVFELDLRLCVLKIPSYAGFSGLKSLRLVNTQLLDQNLFQNFISSCHLLENLSLERCVFHDFKVLDISLRNLRKLVIDGDGCDIPFDEGLSKCELKIACPNLLYFDLSGPFVQSLSWDKYPSFLQTAILFAFSYDRPELNEEFANFVLKILGGVCHVEALKLRISILEYISPAAAKPGCFSTIFYNLKSLRVSTGMEKCYLQSIIYLLNCAPNLQLLSIHIDEEMCEYDYEWKIPDEAIACLTCHLKMVKLIEVDSTDYELEIIGFFLKHGHVLEKMIIIWHSGVQRESQRAAIQEVMKFPRSSSYVTITFSELKQFGCDEL
ncbi:FBD-associated F-box protein At3g49020-like isoform X2 [Durio zibethinus]|uniref:FBD-associated F-box protein At3g49020-like isoform X2 n=1 Tax=Durio zibethinus TaxID=66656 RepID=A0A6P5ZWT2_DURZI|nr:FBD-associated F-box protein At3g49020-like isoform X2 [Durio zibethinus]